MAAIVNREARRLRVSVSEVVRRALRRELHLQEDEPHRLSFIGAGRSSDTQTARNAEDILAREWGNAGRR
jgi:Arc/MetJ-type ribon-helix-helix transcriptional regulator